ncbi:MAG: hypothetical protein QM765_08755 [Myxococcales bacterium]
MISHRNLLFIALGLLVAACSPAQRSVTLKADSRLSGGQEAQVKIDAPAGWIQSVKRADRAVFVAGDNFSSLSFAVQASTVAEERCPELADRAAADAAKALTANPDVKPTFTPAGAGVVDFTLTVPASPPGPSDKFYQGRAVCRSGALAVATCYCGIKKQDSVGQDCKKALESLMVDGPKAAAPVPAPAPEPAQPAVAPAPAPAPAPAAAEPQAPPQPEAKPVEPAK